MTGKFFHELSIRILGVFAVCIRDLYYGFMLSNYMGSIKSHCKDPSESISISTV